MLNQIVYGQYKEVYIIFVICYVCLWTIINIVAHTTYVDIHPQIVDINVHTPPKLW